MRAASSAPHCVVDWDWLYPYEPQSRYLLLAARIAPRAHLDHGHLTLIWNSGNLGDAIAATALIDPARRLRDDNRRLRGEPR